VDNDAITHGTLILSIGSTAVAQIVIVGAHYIPIILWLEAIVALQRHLLASSPDNIG